MEKYAFKKIENFEETVKGADMKDLLILKTALYAGPERRRTYGQVEEWFRRVEKLDPECRNSRLHHFLIGSGTPPGGCTIDDLPGDLSAEAFLRADSDERDRMIERLQAQGDKAVV